ncbi:hypothetical protein ABW19_dt0200003 [Dactylella cylindrospora]|nr:hypothetical protein ABW19_dt0200003 [Dactylella cylindrospora]
MRVFLEARDKFYILLVMNQFQLRKAAEELLTPEELIIAVETAIFSNGVVNGVDLVERRRIIAAELRERRQKGAIPIFLGLIGFFFAMSVAISKAFATGEREISTAFNVGLGLLIAWLPVLNIAAVVDSDHEHKEIIVDRFNELVSLCHTTGDKIEIFGEGRGQGRGRWHYGIGQTIMGRIEDDILDKRSRKDPVDWTSLIETSSKPYRHIEFGHWRIVEPIISAFIIVVGISSGAFILAYFTPPVGIAWRSAAYLTCVCFAVLLFLIDIFLFKIVRHAFMTPTSHRRGTIYNFFKSLKFRHAAHIALTSLEMLNCLMLALLVVAMAAGLFNFCAGSAVDRGGPSGGIIILNDGQFYQKYFDVVSYWILGIVPGMILMCVSLLYLIEQWFSQNFLWAVDNEEALKSWKKTRKWKMFYTLGGLLETGDTLRWTM